jgi:hypothetical protein
MAIFREVFLRRIYYKDNLTNAKVKVEQYLYRSGQALRISAG